VLVDATAAGSYEVIVWGPESYPPALRRWLGIAPKNRGSGDIIIIMGMYLKFRFATASNAN
jgi:hypothetical protein